LPLTNPILTPLAVSAYASEHDNPNDPTPGIPDDTNDPDDPDKNTNEVVAVAMSSNTPAKASAAARAKKKTTAGSKTTGETAADYTTAPPAIQPMKLYYLDSGNKYSICYDLKGTTEYVILTLYLNGMLPPKGGYQCTLAEDSHTIRWSRPVDSFLFSMDHLKGIMGSNYSESNVHVRLFDNILQATHSNKIKPNTNGFFWGKPYEIYFEKNLTGTPDCNDIQYRAPGIESPVEKCNHVHHQYHTMVIVTIQVVDTRRTTTRGKRAKPINLYGIDSSPSVEDDCPPHRGRNNDWGGAITRRVAPRAVICHGILAGTYLAEYRDSLK